MSAQNEEKSKQPMTILRLLEILSSHAETKAEAEAKNQGAIDELFNNYFLSNDIICNDSSEEESDSSEEDFLIGKFFEKIEITFNLSRKRAEYLTNLKENFRRNDLQSSFYTIEMEERGEFELREFVIIIRAKNPVLAKIKELVKPIEAEDDLLSKGVFRLQR